MASIALMTGLAKIIWSVQLLVCYKNAHNPVGGTKQYKRFTLSPNTGNLAKQYEPNTTLVTVTQNDINNASSV